MNNAPLFVVGVQRSGTTLLAAMLAAHSRLSCGPETHFFRRLPEQDERQLVEPSSWPEDAVRFIGSISHTGFSDDGSRRLIEKYNLSEDDVRQYLAPRSPSIAAILAGVTEPYMHRGGKLRWVEKTPDHILYLDSIRCHFPISAIVRIVRDPRDVALSLGRVPWGAPSIEEGLLYWRRLEAAGDAFMQSDANSYTLRYEDLIASPEAELRKLCDFIGEEFEPGMLDTSTTGKQINTRNVAWKERASQPVDASRVFAWRRELTQQQNCFAEAVLGDRLEKYGYPCQAIFSHAAEVFPPSTLAAENGSALGELASRGVRFWRSEQERADTLVLGGDPDGDDWFGSGRWARLRGAAALWLRLARARSDRQKIYWIKARDAGAASGLIGRLVKGSLARYGYDPLTG